MNKENAAYVAVGLKCFYLAVGIPLNVLELTKIVKYWQKRPMTRYLMMKTNLVVSDLMILCMYCGCNAAYLATKTWQGGPFLCKIVQTGVGLSFYLTSFIVCCIAVERCAAVLYPQNSAKIQMLRRAKILNGLAWATAAIFAAPLLLIWEVWSRPEDQGTPQCTTYWYRMKHAHCQKRYWATYALYAAQNISLNMTEKFNWQKCISRQMPLELVYGIIHMISVFWLPLLLIIISNCIILWRGQSKVARYHRKKRCTDDRSSRLLRRPIKSHRSWMRMGNRAVAIKNTLLLSVKYIVTWSPYCVVATVSMAQPGYLQHHFHLMLFIADIIILNSILNPFLYKMPMDTPKVLSSPGVRVRWRQLTLRTHSRPENYSGSPQPRPSSKSPRQTNSYNTSQHVSPWSQLLKRHPRTDCSTLKANFETSLTTVGITLGCNVAYEPGDELL